MKQHTGLAEQVAAGSVTNVVLAVGTNDFAPSTLAYTRIYQRRWWPAQTARYEARVIRNVETALRKLLIAGARVVLVSPFDFNVTPVMECPRIYVNERKRWRVTRVLADVDRRFMRLGQKYGVPVVSGYAFQQAMCGAPWRLHATLQIGGVDIKMREVEASPGADPAAGYASRTHPHTIIHGLLANAILTAFDLAYGEDAEPFSERELLENAGLQYGGVDTLPACVRDYGGFVRLPIARRR